ncbi:bifunctional (p)ppGpp synthase/hydrolase [Malaciobacter canalis]|uniref:Bifunctional (P)ppGpp synthase/hydrolase n=1 Tax=Malaciobacter canalis TaxID=1912871 RepID=A0ABX4LMW1_9BACT|nr:RelA/SpoT family protein [Malaciobacter canalis]PHO09018.1 bifunctional (p)ppGpp synthase/hydrolase [Malaciobacter canalis]QEE32333.1 ppGpp synthetase / guanosine-3',5'-bis(diphosphate) 3' pyrophosphohydrolase [Malaciobacter canalis]
MDPFIETIQGINTIDGAIEELKKHTIITPKLKDIINFTIKAHDNQFRKSGEPYAVHPLLVASITAYFSPDEAVVATSLLHDVVEDTEYDLTFVKENWGEDIAHMVDGLTKIVEIRESEFSSNLSIHEAKTISSAMTFRKMLIASIDDVRVLLVKLCDRFHNMLTLDALPENKQKRIAEETLVVYVPIAHRLGISTLKNHLEDLAFYYIYPKEYNKIDKFIKDHQHAIQLTFNNFISNTKNILEKNGYDASKVKILSRIKHHYSIYLKMQRKGVSIDEVLDLLAIRVLVPEEIDCYKVLGHLHLAYKPLISRFKDYVSTPKENGYRTIHTTVFYNSKIYEIQIRSFEMHKIAEYGIAAHWKYKSGAQNGPNLNWLKSLEFSNENVEEFYADTKDDLYSEEIVVYSPHGDTFNLPRGSTAYDFAYAVHTDVGKYAFECFINKIKKPLLTELKSSDIVAIKTTDYPILRCSWVDMVKTNRAKKQIKVLCSHRQKELNELTGKNIIDTIFVRYTQEITNTHNFDSLHKIANNLDFLRHVKKQIETRMIKEHGLVTRFKILASKLKKYKFDNILIYSNFSINSVSFDHCCHPKFGDDIVAFKDGNKAIIHHKMCDKAYKKIKSKQNMLFCKWTKDTLYPYKMVVSLANTKGELAKLLMYMSKYEGYILSVDYGREKHSYRQYCDIEFEINNSNVEEVRKIVEQKAKVIEFFSKKDAYNK